MTRLEFFKTIGIMPEIASDLKAEPIITGERSLAAVVYPGTLSTEVLQNIKTALKPYEDRHNIEFMVFQEGMYPVRLK